LLLSIYQPSPHGLVTQPDAIGDLAQRQAARREGHELGIRNGGEFRSPLWEGLDSLFNGDHADGEQVSRQIMRVRIPSSPPLCTP
jgi:hypothetical protein